MSIWDVSQTLAKRIFVEKLKVCPRHFEDTQMWDIAHIYYYDYLCIILCTSWLHKCLYFWCKDVRLHCDCFSFGNMQAPNASSRVLKGWSMSFEGVWVDTRFFPRFFEANHLLLMEPSQLCIVTAVYCVLIILDHKSTQIISKNLDQDDNES